jgi:MYXO-CTERM domain-containing protein
MARFFLAALVAALVGCVPWPALANGRFPRAERLIEDPLDRNRLIVAATYGIVTTRDHGRNWHHICERSFTGLEQYVGDPIVDLVGDGAMLVDIQSALHISVDQGCTWSPAFGGPGHYLPDFTITHGPNRSILAIDAAIEDTAVVNRLIESTDQGKSFHGIGTPLPVGVVFTIDVAPSDPGLIYASGLSTANAAVLALSTDHGATWISRAIALGTNELPYIAAIDPHDPQKVYLRVAAITEDSGVPTSNDALLVTTNGGASWREVFRSGAQALGFALSPSGDTVLIGYGDPKSDLSVDPSVLGIYRGDTTNFEFSRLSTTSTTCLAWTMTGIYACTSHIETGHALAFTPAANLSTDGSGFEPLLYLRDVRGPLDCCRGGVHPVCAANWSTTCLVFGACDGGASNIGWDACASDAPRPPLVDAGLADAVSPKDEDATLVSPKDASAGCGCRTTATPRQANEACLAFLLALAAAARRRPRSGRAR